MEHQAQGLVLVNNEWVSRPLDAYQIMAQAQQADIDMQESHNKPTAQFAGAGILSRTLYASPMSTFILPASIRHQDLTDIVQVGEDSVRLKEVCHRGYLRPIGTKTDFNGHILAAKVFGDRDELPATTGVSIQPKNKQAAFREGKSTARDEYFKLPPEVIVLTLTSRTLMFLWARSTHTGAVTFSQRTIRLPASTSRFNHFGTFLAIDPRCRAIAVAAREGRFILYKTKTMQMWQKEMEGGRETTPIEDERIIPIAGRIMHMEFLSSGLGQDKFHVVLLFITAHHGKTKITCFDWDCRHDLSKATVRTECAIVDLGRQPYAISVVA